MDLNLIKNLPDQLESNEIKLYFNEVLKEVNVESVLDKEYVAQALWELSERQWHTYEVLDNETKERVNDWIKFHFTGILSKQFVELIGGIIGMLGLQKAYDAFKEVYNKVILPDHLKDEFENIFREYGDDVSDPYKELR